METVINWIEAHGYKYKIANEYKVYWQTEFQTAEYDLKEDAITWHSYDFFEEV